MTPDQLQGRVQSSMQFVSMSAMPLAPVLAGALLHGLGGPAAIAVLGALTAARRADPHAEPVGALRAAAPGLDR